MAHISGISIRDGIHTDFSTGISGWNTHRTALTGEFTTQAGNTSGRYGEFSKDIQEYNRKIDTLSGAWNDTGMFLTPYNAGFRYTGTGDFNKWDTYSLLLDGVDDYVDAGTALGDALGDNYAGSLTVSLWFKADQTGGHDGLFEFGAFAAANGWMMIDLYADTLRFWPAEAAWSRRVAFTDTTSWHHLVCIYAAGSEANSKMYLDGVVQAGTTIGTFPDAADMDFAGLKTIIGAYYNTSYTFEGNLDEVAIWNSALSAEQITAIYNGGTPQSLAPYSPTAWWRMGDGPLDIGNVAGSAASNGLIGDMVDMTLGSELLTEFTNGSLHPFDTFTSDGRNITSAILVAAGGQWAGCHSNVISMTVGEIYRVSFDLAYHGDIWQVEVALAENDRGKGALRSTDFESLTEGENVGYLFVTESDATAYLQFSNSSKRAINFSASNISLKKLNGYAGRMVNMTASDIVADTP
jgi:hypothetical protein